MNPIFVKGFSQKSEDSCDCSLFEDSSCFRKDTVDTVPRGICREGDDFLRKADSLVIVWQLPVGGQPRSSSVWHVSECRPCHFYYLSELFEQTRIAGVGANPDLTLARNRTSCIGHRHS